MKVLVTGAKGMIGSQLVSTLIASGFNVIGLDRVDYESSCNQYVYCNVNLSDKESLQQVFDMYHPERVVHLAALAHSVDGSDYSWEDYYHLNVECSKNLFEVSGDIPVLFISTVDVYGFTVDTVNVNTKLNPVSNYAKSKAMAENELQKAPHFDIYRFSPVYTDKIKRDIQKRYYLKYPSIAYKIGRGTEYEILNVNYAIQSIISWCLDEPQNSIKIIKDEERMCTTKYIEEEKKEGRARVVIWIPFCLVKTVYTVLKVITGENKYTYLLNKAVNPLRTE